MTGPTASPQWNRDTKVLVTIIALVIFLALAYLARNVIPLLALAAVLAYIFQPVVGWLERRRVPRGVGAVFCLLLLLLMVALGPLLLTPPIVNGVRALIDVLVRLPELSQQWMADVADNQPVISIVGFTLDIAAYVEEAEASLGEAFGQFQFPSLADIVNYIFAGMRTAGGILQTAVGIASSVVSAAFSTLLLLILIFFLTKDGRQTGVWIKGMVLPKYRPEIEELGRRLDVVWKSFFRGQLLLALVIGTMVTVATSVLGLPGALVLGILAGVLEVIPNLGPVLALIPAVLVALIQGSSVLPVSNLVFALIIVGVYVVIQQIENNFLVPRIMGHSLNLHPLLVLIGVVVGASFAGILGAFLAAPVLASLKVLGMYAHAKIIDRDPLAQPLVAEAVESFEPRERWWRRLRRWREQRRASGQATAASGEPAGNAQLETISPVAAESHEEPS
jgi:predicted PurR-regulated permease PerM